MILLQQGKLALRSIISSDVHERDWQRHPVDPYHALLKVLIIHTYLVHKEGISYRYRVLTTIVGVGKRGAYQFVHGDLPRQHSFGTALRFTDPVPADSRQ